MATRQAAEASASLDPHSADSWTQERRLPLDESDAWVDGSIAGVTGAAVVALVFLAVDLAQGVPLRTPGLLGSAFFLGRSVPADAAPSMAAVLGYTLVHGVLFVSAGVAAAYALIGRTQPLSPLLGLGVAAAVFGGMEVVFLLALLMAAPQLIAEFGMGTIAAANALAAGAMAAALLRRHHRLGPKFGQRLSVGVGLALVFVAVLLVNYCAAAYVALGR